MDILGAFLNGLEEYYLKLTLDIILGIQTEPIPEEIVEQAKNQPVQIIYPITNITQEYLEEKNKMSYYGNNPLVDQLNEKLGAAEEVLEELNNAKYDLDNGIDELDTYISDLNDLISSLQDLPEIDLSISVDVNFDSSRD